MSKFSEHVKIIAEIVHEVLEGIDPLSAFRAQNDHAYWRLAVMIIPTVHKLIDRPRLTDVELADLREAVGIFCSTASDSTADEIAAELFDEMREYHAVLRERDDDGTIVRETGCERAWKIN